MQLNVTSAYHRYQRLFCPVYRKDTHHFQRGPRIYRKIARNGQLELNNQEESEE